MRMTRRSGLAGGSEGTPVLVVPDADSLPLLPQAENPVAARIPTAPTAMMRLILTTTPRLVGQKFGRVQRHHRRQVAVTQNQRVGLLSEHLDDVGFAFDLR